MFKNINVYLLVIVVVVVFFSLVLPKIMLPDPEPVFRGYPGIHKLRCSANGTVPMHIVLIRNSTVLVNSKNTAAELGSYTEGNYSCEATNKYGTDTRVISVIIDGETFFLNNCLQVVLRWGRNLATLVWESGKE